MPHLAEALVKIDKENIVDPVYFLADFLEERGNYIQELEYNRVRQNYLNALAEAEAMETKTLLKLQAVTEERDQIINRKQRVNN